MVGRRPLEANIPGSSPGSATNETFLYGKFNLLSKSMNSKGGDSFVTNLSSQVPKEIEGSPGSATRHVVKCQNYTLFISFILAFTSFLINKIGNSSSAGKLTTLFVVL